MLFGASYRWWVSIRAVTIDWRSAVVYVTREPAWQRRVAVGGLLLLLLPPIGWCLALGYRSMVGSALFERRAPLLPSWRGHVTLSATRGIRSMAVILAYLTPFLIAYWWFGARSMAALGEHWREVAAFVAAVLVFPPVALPGFPLWYGLQYEWLHFTPLEIVTLAILFFGPIAFAPAAFLQVAQTGRFRSAFNVADAFGVIVSAPGAYLQAWIVALTMSAVAVLIVPLMPWLVFWSYLAITHLFLQVLASAQTVVKPSSVAPAGGGAEAPPPPAYALEANAAGYGGAGREAVR